MSRFNVTIRTSPPLFPMDATIAVGFGRASVFKDGNPVYDETQCERAHVEAKGQDTTEWPPFWTGQDAENAAAADPDHDWRITIHGPLKGGSWKRTAPETWELVEDFGGFA